jgi:GT2 family glycosyltransferase
MDRAIYARWLVRHAPWGASQERALRSKLASRDAPRPLISVLMPAYNPPERWLRRAVASLQAQVYDRWELCIADDASDAPHVRPLLEELARDSRIRVAYRSCNGHIAAASNTALELCSGEWVALLDQDDELHPAALAEVALALQANPSIRLVYTDEDKIDERGERFEPFLKPEWNPDLLLGVNYISHLSVLHAATVRSLGGFRVGFEGSQDWDLVLRLTEAVRAEAIVRIPQILYHWRALPSSTAQTTDAKPYVVRSARRALEEACRRRGIDGVVTPVAEGAWTIRRTAPVPLPRVTLIVTSCPRDFRPELWQRELERRTDYPPCEVVTLPRRGSCVWSLRDRSSALITAAAEKATGEVLVLLDFALLPSEGAEGWLKELVVQSLRPDVGAVGALLYDIEGQIHHAGLVLGVGGLAANAFGGFPAQHPGQMNRARLVQNYSAVNPACLAIRRSTLLGAGRDARLCHVGAAMLDLCLRLQRAGRRHVWTPHAKLRFAQWRSAAFRPNAGESAILRQRWGRVLDHDPAYHPLLRRAAADFAPIGITPPTPRERGFSYLTRHCKRPTRYNARKLLLALALVLTNRNCARLGFALGTNSRSFCDANLTILRQES